METVTIPSLLFGILVTWSYFSLIALAWIVLIRYFNYHPRYEKPRKKQSSTSEAERKRELHYYGGKAYKETDRL